MMYLNKCNKTGMWSYHYRNALMYGNFVLLERDCVYGMWQYRVPYLVWKSSLRGWNEWKNLVVIYVNIHYNDVIMSAMASQITSLTMVYSTYSTVYPRRRSKKTAKLRVTGLCEGNSPVTGEFPAQRASKAENVSIWWRHHVYKTMCS